MVAWDWVDAVLYINLAERVDRKEHMLAELEIAGVPEEKIWRIDAVRMKPGALGCTLSHIKAFQLIQEKGWQKVLVLEDDFTWMPYTEISECIADIGSIKKSWDVIQISWNPCARLIGDGPISCVRRAVDVRTTSGYFVRGKFVQDLLENFKEAAINMYKNGHSPDSCCDMNWQKLQHDTDWYVAYPPLGYQMDGWSDVEGREVSYGC
jgi:glycosyl transferase family 25